MTRILLIGKNGQIGWELERELAALGQVTALARPDVDLGDSIELRRVIRSASPDVIINAAAYTAVDKAEEERDLAMRVNGIAPGVMAEEARRSGALLVHYSTDYVFDGTKQEPYIEDDRTNPPGVYGASKLAGENAIREAGCRHLILRTSWIYAARGRNFLLTVRRLAQERDELRIVNDQFGAPTWSRPVAQATATIVARLCAVPSAERDEEWRRVSGVYHLSAAGRTSWYEFAREVLRLTLSSEALARKKVVPIKSHEWPSPARRPMNSVLSNEKVGRTFAVRLPSWDEGLAQCLSAECRVLSAEC